MSLASEKPPACKPRLTRGSSGCRPELPGSEQSRGAPPWDATPSLPCATPLRRPLLSLQSTWH